MNQKSEILSAIRTVYNSAKGSRLDEAFSFAVSKDLRLLEKYFQVDKRKVVLLTILVSYACRGRTVDSSDIISYTNIDPLQILEYAQSLTELAQRNFITRASSRRGKQSSVLSDSFSVNPSVIWAIQEGKPLPVLSDLRCENALEFLESVSELGGSFSTLGDDEDLTEISKDFERLVGSNQHLSFTKRFAAMNLPYEDLYLICSTTWKQLNGSNSISLCEIVDKYFKRKLDRVQYTQGLLHGKNKLIVEDLVKIGDAEFYHSPTITVTARFRGLLEQEGIQVSFTQKVESKNIIAHDKIVKKELFYNAEELKQIELLTSCLTDAGFQKTQKKLIANGMPPGVTAILYGPPGTGKTELVYQIARKTGRDIFPVDCTAIRDKFFGASESKLNEVFRNYEAYCASAKRAGLLLLNEGDQLLGARRSMLGGSHAASHAVSQTENNLINLMLENLERNKNIILITSNMPQNIDFAAQRRILFRINVQIGSQEIQAKIWKSRIKDLPDELCQKLIQYNLGGGNIENAIKRFMLNSALNKDNNLNNLLEYARQESQTWGEKRNKIGY